MPISPLALLALRSMVRSRAELQLENLALRHQIWVFQRSARKRSKLTLLGFPHPLLEQLALNLGHREAGNCGGLDRKCFRLFWTWKVQHGQPGRPVVAREVRDLIRQMCRENPTWGAPRIHGELLKLGIDIGETSVSK